MDIVTLSLAKKYTNNIIDGFGRGILYKGAVNYYTDLPNNASLGDCYSVLYEGTSGDTPFGAEYVWGKINNQNSATWIQLGKDIDTNSFEKKENKVSEINENSTDTQYPTAKCVYDLIGDISTILQQLDTGSGV